MVGTKVIRVPSLGVAAIAEPANIALELDSMACMVGLFEAAGAYNASRVLLAVQAPPRNFAMLQLLRTDSSGGPYYGVNVVDRASELVAIIGELLSKVALRIRREQASSMQCIRQSNCTDYRLPIFWNFSCSVQS